MAPQGAKRWLRKLPGPVLVWPGLLLALLWLPAVPAQTGPQVHYLKYTSFTLPFNIPPAQQPNIAEVVLHVSDNDGQSFQIAATAPPTGNLFKYTAPHQGWFLFVVQAKYRDGRLAPSDVRLVVPGLRVFVDTTPPVITLKQTPPRDGTLAIEWDIQDANLDLETLHIDYRPYQGPTWIPLNILKSPYGQFSWTPAAPAPQYEVRLYVTDRAGNAAQKFLTLAPGQTQQAFASSSPPPPPAQSRTMMVHSRNLRLSYDLTDVGKSNVSKIQVWATQDTKAWKKLTEQEQANPPVIDVQVDREGRWGFKLLARSGVGRGEPEPQPGTQPDFWVQVDESKPVVAIQGVSVDGTPENALMTIRWTATDPHLAEKPITISYSENGQPPWTTMVNGLANDGRFVWSIPTELPHHSVFIKVEAADQAGNVGFAQTDKPVPIDLAVPKVRIKNVEGAGAIPGQSAAPGNPSPIVQATGVTAAPPPAPPAAVNQNPQAPGVPPMGASGQVPSAPQGFPPQQPGQFAPASPPAQRGPATLPIP